MTTTTTKTVALAGARATPVGGLHFAPPPSDATI